MSKMSSRPILRRGRTPRSIHEGSVMPQTRFARRALLRAGAGTGVAAGAAAISLPLVLARGGAAAGDHAGHGPTRTAQEGDHVEGHGPNLAVGDVDIARLGWDPSTLLTDFDYGEVTEIRPDGTAVREWTIVAF